MTQFHKIIRDYFTQFHSSEVHKSFVDWLVDGLSANEKNNALMKVWDELEIAPDETAESSFAKLQQRISSEQVSQQSHTKSLCRQLLRIASVVLIPVISFAGAYLYVRHTEQAIRTAELVECFVPNGEIREIVLPDSSVVQINSGSMLIYPKAFSGKTRDIYLNGEASFTVAHNKQKPFIVKTADMDVEVLGTIFNISSYCSDDRVSTTLERGKVNVRLKDGSDNSFILKPDEQISFDRSTKKININKVNVDNAVAWKKGYLIVKGQTIRDISKILERKYNVEIHVNSNKYNTQHITAKFKNNEGLLEGLSVLQQLIPGMKYKIEGNIIYIY